MSVCKCKAAKPPICARMLCTRVLHPARLCAHVIQGDAPVKATGHTGIHDDPLRTGVWKREYPYMNSEEIWRRRCSNEKTYKCRCTVLVCLYQRWTCSDRQPEGEGTWDSWKSRIWPVRCFSIEVAIKFSFGIFQMLWQIQVVHNIQSVGKNMKCWRNATLDHNLSDLHFITRKIAVRRVTSAFLDCRSWSPSRPRMHTRSHTQAVSGGRLAAANTLETEPGEFVNNRCSRDADRRRV